MIFETLNDNVMLVELSKEEMEKFHITYDSLDNNNENVKTAIKGIIRKIYTGDRLSKGEKVIVEAMPTDEGGCFFIFTFTTAKKRKYRLRKKDDFVIFCTDNLNNLLDFISVIPKTIKNNQNCEVFNMQNKYFMVIPDFHDNLKPVIYEYGEIYPNIDYARLKEYGNLMGNVYLQ